MKINMTEKTRTVVMVCTLAITIPLGISYFIQMNLFSIVIGIIALLSFGFGAIQRYKIYAAELGDRGDEPTTKPNFWDIKRANIDYDNERRNQMLDTHFGVPPNNEKRK